MSDEMPIVVEPPLPEIVVVVEPPQSEIVVVVEPVLPGLSVVVEPPQPDITVVVEPPPPEIIVTVSEPGQGAVGPQGPIGLTGPQGPPGEDGSGNGDVLGTLLSGVGKPLQDSGVEPLDGVNDPWRLYIPDSSDWGGPKVWASPMYTIAYGDGITSFPGVSTWHGEGVGLELWISFTDTPLGVYNGYGDARRSYSSFGDINNPVWIPGDPIDLAGDPFYAPGPIPLDYGLSAMLVWRFADDTLVLPEVKPDIAEILGPDFQVGTPIVLREIGTGQDKDFYINKGAGVEVFEMWGPKDTAYDGWGRNPIVVHGIDVSAYHTWYGGQKFGRDVRDPVAAPLSVEATDRIPDGYLSDTTAAIWLDTSGPIPALTASGLDANGNRYDLVMTPASP